MLKDLSYESVENLERIAKAWHFSKVHYLNIVMEIIEQAKSKRILEEAQGVCYD